MLRHIVMWKLKEFAEGATRAENAERFKAKLETCRSIVDGQGLFEVGTAKPGFNCTYDVVLVSDFDDVAALESYLAHPKHQALADFAAPIREDRQVLDYEA
ncbi:MULTISPECIES: Dabb family protein [Burkholderiaceae]|uniref:Stress responsive protein n=1 Tax=Caballeronia zhejiangensis TaxID=871203 RepID=A0A656QA67_9BURK|nr:MULTISPECIES: Dabb family protein [Burkholderiaceae]KAK42461.1 stress responsive protein [Caballeronia jiangsuensis]KDR24683.1 stress responsive protein [Caballeronia zhejiangensis]KWU24264.1 stress responsive protein [Burkholderia cenocepacia]SAL77556.1 stress responsive alpha-beta barrel domain-containing protein [Caballeronia peredens]